MSTADLEKTAEEHNELFTTTINRGDAAALAELFDEDAILLPPNDDVARGKAGARRVMDGLVAARLNNAAFETLRVIDGGDFAIHVARFSHDLERDGARVREAGKFVEVWKRQVDGSWKTVVDIWNMDPD